MRKFLPALRYLTVSASVVMALAAPLTSHADTLPTGRAVLNVCSGGASAAFTQACESHAGYFAVNLKLSGDGGCLEMCCSGDASSGYSCVSDPNAIRRVSAIWQGPLFPAVVREKELNSLPAPEGVVVTVTVNPTPEKK